MRLSTRSYGLVVVLILAVLLLSGCFQDAASDLQPTAPGQFLPSTPLPQPTTAVVQATLPFAQPTNPPLLQPTTQVPFQPQVTNTFPVGLPTVAATPVTGQLPVVQPTSDARFGTLSPAAMTATAILAGANPMPTPLVPNAQMATPSLFPSTSFPVLQQTPELGAAALSATAIIATGTQQAAMQQTFIATSMGTYVPSPTPSPTATRDPNMIPEDCVHTVARGETAYRIARQWGVTLDAIAQANGLTNLSVLSVGQDLIIPECGTTGITPTPGPQSTATPLPQGVFPEATVTETTSAEASEAGMQTTYLIQPGDNLYRIALRYGVTMRALANANGITNINLIRAGDTLIIPAQ